MKQVAQHALPHNTTYRLVDSFHTGGMENACGCMNCGRAITNVGVLEDANGGRFQVGLDCAASLSSLLDNQNELNRVEVIFGRLKQTRAAILKEQKASGEYFQVYVFQGPDDITVEGRLRHKPGTPAYMEGSRFRHYYQADDYAKIIKPACGALLPDHVMTVAEYNQALQDAYNATLAA